MLIIDCKKEQERTGRTKSSPAQNKTFMKFMGKHDVL